MAGQYGPNASIPVFQAEPSLDSRLDPAPSYPMVFAQNARCPAPWGGQGLQGFRGWALCVTRGVWVISTIHKTPRLQRLTIATTVAGKLLAC